MERQRPAPPPQQREAAAAGDVPDDGFSEARATVLMLGSEVLEATDLDASQAAADQLREALFAMVDEWPAERVQPLVRALLDDPLLGERLDGRGHRLRVAFVSAQQALGFPFALEVEPEDLALMRPRAPLVRRGDLASALVFVAGAGATLWNVALLFTVLPVIGSGLELSAPSVGGAFLGAGVAHALVAMRTVARGRRADRVAIRRTLRQLAWAALLGPLGALSVALADARLDGRPLILEGLVAALPSMTVALLCGIAAARLKPQRAVTAPEAPSAAPPEPP